MTKSPIRAAGQFVPAGSFNVFISGVADSSEGRALQS